MTENRVFVAGWVESLRGPATRQARWTSERLDPPDTTDKAPGVVQCACFRYSGSSSLCRSAQSHPSAAKPPVGIRECLPLPVCSVRKPRAPNEERLSLERALQAFPRNQSEPKQVKKSRPSRPLPWNC